jgi:hypothetical protein
VVLNQQTPMSAFLTDADYPGGALASPHSLVTRAAYCLADAIVTTSAGVADDLVAAFGVPRGHIQVVHNPADLDAIRPWPENRWSRLTRRVDPSGDRRRRPARRCQELPAAARCAGDATAHRAGSCSSSTGRMRSRDAQRIARLP